MANVPALRPATVSITPGVVPAILTAGYDGSTTTSTADLVPTGDVLDMTFEGITEAEARGVVDHQDGEEGRAFQFTSTTLAAGLTPAGYKWTYAQPISQDDIHAVAGSEFYRLSIRFLGVRIRRSSTPSATATLQIRTTAAKALPAGTPSATATLRLTTTAAGMATGTPSQSAFLLLKTTAANTISTPLNDPLYGSVILHLPFNNTTGFTDVSGNSLITPQGGVSIDSSQGRWGNGSALYDGNGDFISADLPEALGTGPYTIRFWFNIINADNQDGLYQFTNASNTFGALRAFLGSAAGGSYPVGINNDPNGLNITVGSIPSSVWCFYQQTRDEAGGVRTSISSVGSATVYDPILTDPPRPWTDNFSQMFLDIGLQFDTTNYTFQFNGRMADFQVTKAARPHTVPTGPLPIF